MIIRRVFLIVCVSSAMMGITIIWNNIGKRTKSLQVFIERRSLRNDDKDEGSIISSRGGDFYDLSHFTNDEYEIMIKIAYSLTKLQDSIDWTLQRNNFITSVTHNRHHGNLISVRTTDRSNDDAYDGDIDDTLDILSSLAPSEKRVGIVEKDGDDAYFGGIDDTLGIVSSTIVYDRKMGDALADDTEEASTNKSENISVVDANDDAYDGGIDDTLLPEASAFASLIYNVNKDEPDSLPTTYLRYDRRRLQENNIDGDVFDGYEYNQGACPNAGSLDVPCAPSNLSSICNKYDSMNGSFKECLEACKPAFCCIHDAPRESNYLSPNCNTDENCPQYNYCYIVWWKLHDTVGPALFMRVDQDDNFYDGAEDMIDPDSTEDPFMTQVLLHHFDDINQVIEDGTVDNEFDADRIFLNEDYWMYPEAKKVDINV